MADSNNEALVEAVNANSVAKALIMAYIRKFVTVAATAAVTKGLVGSGTVTESTIELISGGIFLAISILWSHMNAKKNVLKVAEAKVTAVATLPEVAPYVPAIESALASAAKKVEASMTIPENHVLTWTASKPEIVNGVLMQTIQPTFTPALPSVSSTSTTPDTSGQPKGNS